MKFRYPRVGAIAASTMFVAALLGVSGSGAAAQDRVPEVVKTILLPTTISEPVIQPLPHADAAVDPEASAQTDADPGTAPAAATLAALVAEQASSEPSPELRCLAGAIYFEAKSETLPGQLAVARVIVNRSKSGRFPASYCGVVTQPSQFSFVRGHAIPAVNTGSQDWREAVAIARIADAGGWRSPAEGALFFHATHVSPRWRLTRIARVDNHVFYR